MQYSDETARLADFVPFALLGDEVEDRFDRVTRLARRIFDSDAAIVVSLGDDRPWLLASRPDDVSRANCRTLAHDPEIGFYEGQTIYGPGGSPWGTLCIFGREPREFSEEDRATLRELAAVIEDEITATATGTTDELTGLANRRGFDLVGRTILEVCRRTARHASVLFVDVDGLKEINDRHGHAAGDRALRAVAEILAEEFRASDVVARLGGDEFAVFLTATGDPDPAIDKLHDRITWWNKESDEPFELSASVGTAWFEPESGLELGQLLDRADAAMYQEKQRR